MDKIEIEHLRALASDILRTGACFVQEGKKLSEGILALIDEAEQASQRKTQLETYVSDNQHIKAICDCGDSIEPETGAVCGNCASETQNNLDRLIEDRQASQLHLAPFIELLEYVKKRRDVYKSPMLYDIQARCEKTLEESIRK